MCKLLFPFSFHNKEGKIKRLKKVQEISLVFKGEGGSRAPKNIVENLINVLVKLVVNVLVKTWGGLEDGDIGDCEVAFATEKL